MQHRRKQSHQAHSHVYSTKKLSLQNVIMVVLHHNDPVMPKQWFCSWSVILIDLIFVWWWNQSWSSLAAEWVPYYTLQKWATLHNKRATNGYLKCMYKKWNFCLSKTSFLNIKWRRIVWYLIFMYVDYVYKNLNTLRLVMKIMCIFAWGFLLDMQPLIKII